MQNVRKKHCATILLKTCKETFTFRLFVNDRSNNTCLALLYEMLGTNHGCTRSKHGTYSFLWKLLSGSYDIKRKLPQCIFGLIKQTLPVHMNGAKQNNSTALQDSANDIGLHGSYSESICRLVTVRKIYWAFYTGSFCWGSLGQKGFLDQCETCEQCRCCSTSDKP